MVFALWFFLGAPNLVITFDIDEGLSVLGLVEIEDVDDQADFSCGETCGVLSLVWSISLTGGPQFNIA